MFSACSLSSLADVLAALAKKQQHVPYRNSKLTHVLQDTIGMLIVDVPIFGCTYIWMYLYLDVPLFGCTYIWMYMYLYLDVPLFGCTFIWMYLYLDVPIFGCTYIWMYLYLDVPLFGCTCIWMYLYFPSPDLHHRALGMCTGLPNA